MLKFAYTDCGLSVERFFELSFFEWSLELQKLKKKNEAIHSKWEWDWARTRSLWLILANVNRDHKSRPTPFAPSDLIKLSFDKDDKPIETRELTPEEIEKKFGKFLKT